MKEGNSLKWTQRIVPWPLLTLHTTETDKKQLVWLLIAELSVDTEAISKKLLLNFIIFVVFELKYMSEFSVVHTLEELKNLCHIRHTLLKLPRDVRIFLKIVVFPTYMTQTEDTMYQIKYMKTGKLYCSIIGFPGICV